MTDNNQMATTEEVKEVFKVVCNQLIPFLKGHNVPDYDLVNDYVSNRDMVRNHHTGKLTTAYVTKVQAERDVESQKELVKDQEDSLLNAQREHKDNENTFEEVGEEQADQWEILSLNHRDVDLEFELRTRKEKQKIDAQKEAEREQLRVAQTVVISAIEEKMTSSHSAVSYQENKGQLNQIMLAFAY